MPTKDVGIKSIVNYKDNWRNNTDPYFYPELNWKDLLYKKVAFSQQYNLNMSGGTSFVKYFASIGYTKDGDVFKTEKQPEYDPTFKYERYNYRTNLDMDVTKYTKNICKPCWRYSDS